MRPALIATLTVFVMVLNVAADPIPPYGVCRIAEFQPTDSGFDKIVLCGIRYGWPYSAIRFPCAVNAFSLRIASRNSKSSFTATFNADTLAVITIPSGWIQANDTLEILDTARSQNKNDTCIFVVRPVKAGHSLIDTATRSLRSYNPLEIGRTDLWNKKNLSTIHALHLVDSTGTPLPSAYIYKSYMTINVANLGKFSPPPVILDTVFLIGDPHAWWLGFSQDSFPHHGGLSSFKSPANRTVVYPGTFIDSLYSTTETVTVPFSYSAVRRRQPEPEAPRSLHLSAVPAPGNGIAFVITTEQPIFNAVLEILTINGRTVWNTAISSIAPGTNTVVWNGSAGRHRSAAGTYVSKLKVAGKALLTQRVVVP